MPFKNNSKNGKKISKYIVAVILCLATVFLCTVCVSAAKVTSAGKSLSIKVPENNIDTSQVDKKEDANPPSDKEVPAGHKVGKTGAPMLGGSENIVHKAEDGTKKDFWSVTKNLFSGFGESLKIFFSTVIFALPLGLLISFGSMCKWVPLRAVVRTFVWIIRGTPLMLQLFVFSYYNYFIPGLPPCTFEMRIYVAIIAFVINYACYFSEIYRSGIESMSKGQYEAAAVLGLSKSETFFKVILFQVVKKIVPPIGNEIITLVKDTSLVRIISVAEILWAAEKYLNKGLIWPVFYTGAFYLLFSGILTLLFGYLEKKMSYYKE